MILLSLQLVLLQTVVFIVAQLGSAAIKTREGVANKALKETSELLTAVQPNATLYDAAIFVDFNRASMAPSAKEEL